MTVVTARRAVGRRRSSRPAGGVSQLHFEETDLSGAYQVKVGPPLALESTFAANPDPAESDPAKLDRAALAEPLPGWNFAYLTNWKELTARRHLGRPPRRAAPALALRRARSCSWSNRSWPGSSGIMIPRDVR